VSRPEFETAKDKLDFLCKNKFYQLSFKHIKPDKKYNWINQSDSDFDDLLSLIDKEVKNGKSEEAIFKLFSLGIITAKDEWLYSHSFNTLTKKAEFLCDVFMSEQKRWNKSNKSTSLGDFLDKEIIKWSNELQDKLGKRHQLIFDVKNIKNVLTRPFVKKFVYWDTTALHRLHQLNNMFNDHSLLDNPIICVTAHKQVPFCVQASIYPFDYGYGSRDTQGLPLYYYDENGNKIDNITDWGLKKFQDYYQDKTISKEDIFNYTYAVLHNPAYRSKYELNLKREFPRIPLYENFPQWVNWRGKLINLHINYETVNPYPLTRVDIPSSKDKITPKLKADKPAGKIILDDVTTLEKIPATAWEYKLGNRCALEWILDQYKEKKPKDKTIAEKFNSYRFVNYKDKVIDLLTRVCTVSVETMAIIEEMKNLS
jgi:predicted helicase